MVLFIAQTEIISKEVSSLKLGKFLHDRTKGEALTYVPPSTVVREWGICSWTRFAVAAGVGP